MNYSWPRALAVVASAVMTVGLAYLGFEALVFIAVLVTYGVGAGGDL